MGDYIAFLETKRRVVHDYGRDVDPDDVHESLFPFQRDLTRWALRKGQAALFADTGLGKTRMQIEWARLTGESTLILAPLAVAQQTIAEARRMGVTVTYAHSQNEATQGITISNYERLHLFDPKAYGAVVLDESSILKSFSGTTKKALVAAFRNTPYRLCCTATPAPNDIEELCNHADFLGVMTPSEMRSTFFIADNRGEFMRYRLKGHAHGSFYRWLASWAVAVRTPSDLGYPNDGFILPGLDICSHVVASDWRPDTQLFTTGLNGVGQAAAVRKATLDDRVAAAVATIEAEPDEAWIVWCGLNDESAMMAKNITDAVEVAGSDHHAEKAARLLGFADGTHRVLVTKPSIAGFGMNFQRCARMLFVGLGYSYEQYYQAIRRCYRFGQKRPVEVHIVLSEPERDVLDIVLAKERQAQALSGGLLAGMAEHTHAQIFAGTSRGDDYQPHRPATMPDWLTTEAQ